MALQSSGVISLNDVNVEMGTSGTISLNDAGPRNLARISSGSLSLYNFYGKSLAGFMLTGFPSTPTKILAAKDGSGNIYIVSSSYIVLMNSSGVVQWQKSVSLPTIIALDTDWSNNLFIAGFTSPTSYLIKVNVGDGSIAYTNTLANATVTNINVASNVSVTYVMLTGNTTTQGAGAADSLAWMYNGGTGAIIYQRSVGNTYNQYGQFCVANTDGTGKMLFSSQYASTGSHDPTLISLTATGTTTGTVYSRVSGIYSSSAWMSTTGSYFTVANYTNPDSYYSWRVMYSSANNANTWAKDSGTSYDGVEIWNLYARAGCYSGGNFYVLYYDGLTNKDYIIGYDTAGNVILTRSITGGSVDNFSVNGTGIYLVMSAKILKLPIDGSGLGSFIVNGVTYVYSNASVVTNNAVTGNTTTTRTLTNGARTLTASTASYTSTTSGTVFTKTVI